MMEIQLCPRNSVLLAAVVRDVEVEELEALVLMPLEVGLEVRDKTAINFSGMSGHD